MEPIRDGVVCTHTTAAGKIPTPHSLNPNAVLKRRDIECFTADAANFIPQNTSTQNESVETPSNHHIFGHPRKHERDLLSPSTAPLTRCGRGWGLATDTFCEPHRCSSGERASNS